MTALLTADNAKVLQQTMRMLDQQFWRWGCDAKHSTGNLLTQYGFLRIPRSNPSSSKSSIYQLELGLHSRVVLSSSVMIYGEDDKEGVLFKRFDCRPYSTRMGGVLDSLSAAEKGIALALFDNESWRKLALQLIAVIIDYETWVTSHFGRKYISASLNSKNKRPIAQASEAQAEWKKLACRIL